MTLNNGIVSNMTVNNIRNGRNDTNSIINLNYSFFGNMDTVFLKCSNFENQFKNRNTNKCHDKDFVARKKEQIFQEVCSVQWKGAGAGEFRYRGGGRGAWWNLCDGKGCWDQEEDMVFILL